MTQSASPSTIHIGFMRRSIVAVGIVLAGAASGCGDGHDDGLYQSVPASEFSAEVGARWFAAHYDLVKANRTSPPRASRQFGYAGVALYEATVHGMPGYRSLAGQLNGLSALPSPIDAVHHWPLVANAALARMMSEFHPEDDATITALEQEIVATYRANTGAEVVERSAAYGGDLADAILAWAAGDGSADLAACGAAFVPPRDPLLGGWTPTGPGPIYGLEPCWGSLRPFVLVEASDCAAGGAPAYSTSRSSAFYAQALAVYNTTGDGGAALSPDETAIANYWADGAGDTGTPPGHWIAIVGAVLDEGGFGLDVAAEAYARVGMAVADAFIVCWEEKYATYLMRPITYIQANIDPEWEPMLATPGFASYSSGHSTQSGAAASVLTSFFGPLAFTDTTHTRLNPELGLADRSFANFYEASNEAAVSRLYGGIHYIFDNEDGFDQGLCVGAVHAAAVDFVK